MECIWKSKVHFMYLLMCLYLYLKVRCELYCITYTGKWFAEQLGGEHRGRPRRSTSRRAVNLENSLQAFFFENSVEAGALVEGLLKSRQFALSQSLGISRSWLARVQLIS